MMFLKPPKDSFQLFALVAVILLVFQRVAAADCQLATFNAALDSEIGTIFDQQKLKGGFFAAFTTRANFFYSHSTGVAKHDGTPIDTAKTLFRWASVSKSAVGMIAAFLEEEGEVDLDLDISECYSDYQIPSRYLSSLDGTAAASADCCVLNTLFQFTRQLPEENPFITLRQLMSHRGGIQLYQWPPVLHPPSTSPDQ